MAAVCAGEAWLVRKTSKSKARFFFRLTLKEADAGRRDPSASDVLGVDVGEITLAATSSGKVLSAHKMKYDRDRYHGLRRRLRRNGSPSAKQALGKVSRRERRRVSDENHVVSKAIVTEACRGGAGTIALETLTQIRQRIRAGKRLRRWPWYQLQDMAAYKAA